jgi:hypothetical protein
LASANKPLICGPSTQPISPAPWWDKKMFVLMIHDPDGSSNA